MANEKRLIDANDVPKLFEKKYEETQQRIIDGETYLDTLAEGFTEADDVIQAMPTVDAVEVVHARWEEVGVADYKCSRCGFRFTSADPISMFQYCRCGAKMDGDGDG